MTILDKKKKEINLQDVLVINRQNIEFFFRILS